MHHTILEPQVDKNNQWFLYKNLKTAQNILMGYEMRGTTHLLKFLQGFGA